MGWFRKKDRVDKDDPSEPPSTLDQATGIDFAKYELDQLGNDIRSIIDVPGAIGQAFKIVVTLPFVVAIVTWIAFSSRMSVVALVLFSLVAFVLSFLGSVVLGGFFVARKRLDLVADAANRVVDVVGEMHADVVLVKDGHAGTSVQGVAVGLLENAIFPAVFGTLSATAEAAMGPLGRFSSSITKAPMNMVQKSVINAIQSLPDREIGQIIDGIGEDLPAAAAVVQGLGDDYRQARDKIEGIVATVSRTALGSTLGLAGVATIPLALWLILGWVLS